MQGERLLITGGAGFIGSALVRAALEANYEHVAVLDALTYAGHRENLRGLISDRFEFYCGDICCADFVRPVLDMVKPTHIAHLAAESHVDRSIDGPMAFVQTNIVGTAVLLEAARRYWGPSAGRFLHVSTDEVWGSLGPRQQPFCEDSAYEPRSPYAASKAASDHLAMAWHATYGLPVIVTHCTNNYGPRQLPEKLIPRTVLRALAGESIDLYGDGLQVRDWIAVEDHVAGLLAALSRGEVGGTYIFGAESERSNLDIVRMILDALEKIGPRRKHDLIRFVQDRPGHDRRYAVDPTLTMARLDWRPAVSLEEGICDTVKWYLNNPAWCAAVAKNASLDRRQGLGA